METLLRRSFITGRSSLCARCLRQSEPVGKVLGRSPQLKSPFLAKNLPGKSWIAQHRQFASLGAPKGLPLRSSRISCAPKQQVRGAKTVQEAASKIKTGPFSLISVGLFFAAGIGMLFYFRYEKARLERKRVADMSKGMGKPKVGGLFELTDQDGKTWSSENMKGRFSLVYFGFSHCPDICPEELDKMAEMLDQVAQEIPPSTTGNPDLLPVFITCDPARDTPQVLKEYLKEFHPKLIGLTGTWEQIKAVCRLYRVYFSTPSGVKPGMDYLVDHSIYFYLMDPQGDFVEAIGRQHTAEQGAKLMIDHMSDWKGKIPSS